MNFCFGVVWVRSFCTRCGAVCLCVCAYIFLGWGDGAG